MPQNVDTVVANWTSSGGQAVDERLLRDTDGQVRLVVLRPRTGRDRVGTFLAPGGDDLDAVLATGADRTYDAARTDPGTDEVREAAERLVTAARTAPLAVVAFGAALTPARAITLVVLGAGSADAEFELDPQESAVHFSADGQPVSWLPIPEPANGFTTPDAEVLGGVRRTAVVTPGTLAALVFDAAVPADATHLAIQVLGWLHVPGIGHPERFEARTADVAV